MPTLQYLEKKAEQKEKHRPRATEVSTANNAATVSPCAGERPRLSTHCPFDARVPGQLIIRPHSTGAQFDTGLVNMTHSINHLSFGIRDALQTKPLSLTDMDGAYAEALNTATHNDKRWLMEVATTVAAPKPYVSESEHITHEHYLKVVSTDYRSLGNHQYQT